MLITDSERVPQDFSSTDIQQHKPNKSWWQRLSGKS